MLSHSVLSTDKLFTLQHRHSSPAAFQAKSAINSEIELSLCMLGPGQWGDLCDGS